MVDKNELKLGNWVWYESTIHVITCIDEAYSESYWKKGGNKEERYPHSYLHIDGLEITEELLKELGFKKWRTEKSTTYNYKKLILHKRKRGWVINKRYKEPKYIHQVQNLISELI